MIMGGWGRPGLEVMRCGFLETCKDNEQINWFGTFGTFFYLALVCTLLGFALVVGILLPFYPTEAWTAASWGGACFIFLCIFIVPLNNRLSIIFIEPILLLLPMSNSYPWANCFIFLGEFIKISKKGGKNGSGIHGQMKVIQTFPLPPWEWCKPLNSPAHSQRK